MGASFSACGLGGEAAAGTGPNGAADNWRGQRMNKLRVARCSCGSISAMVSAEPSFTVLCHCIECQRRTGSPFGVLAYFRREDVLLEGASKSYKRKVEGAERTVTDYFCPNCGSTVYCTLDLRPQHIGIAVGNFADPTVGRPVRSVWTRHKHEWVTLPPDIPAFAQAAK